jgi:hypothetical protein
MTRSYANAALLPVIEEENMHNHSSHQPYTTFIFAAEALVRDLGRMVGLVGLGGGDGSVAAFHAPQVVGNGAAYFVPCQGIFGYACP